jgi:glycosyltransferase involved in cell wall biosynthesis
VRVVALLAVHDEERFVGGCIGHLAAHGVETYLIDDGSTDRTVEIADEFRGRGLAGIETFPRGDGYAWRRLLARKQELAATLDADWLLHVDADEVRLPPRSGVNLAEALAEVDRQGYDAVNFLEHTFVPTREHPDHDHPRYEQTMRAYYPFLPSHPNRLNAWKRQEHPVDLVSSGGHVVSFPGLRMYPQDFPMRHYLFLSVEHALRKYVQRAWDPAELEAGLHRRRAALRAEDVALQSEGELRAYVSDDLLDSSAPRTEHPLFAGIGVGGPS